jgi:hypothetical protein
MRATTRELKVTDNYQADSAIVAIRDNNKPSAVSFPTVWVKAAAIQLTGIPGVGDSFSFRRQQSATATATQYFSLGSPAIQSISLV